MDFSQRLKKARLEKGFSKSELAAQVGVHFSQIGRYEEKGALPSADVMANIANVLEVTTDYLMNGTSDDMANHALTDKELINQFKAIEQMNAHDKDVIKTLVDAFITKAKIKKLVL